jgi:cyanate permease
MTDSRRALVLTVLAFLWSIGLIVAALVAPVYGPATLVEENGRGVLLVVAAPSVVSALVWIALWRKCSRGGRVSDYVVWAGVSVLAVLCVLGLASIGLVIAPVPLLLARAASLTPSGSPPGPPGERLA